MKTVRAPLAGLLVLLALFPTPAVERPAPARNEMGQPLLALPCGSLTLGLVVEGTGEGAGS